MRIFGGSAKGRLVRAPKGVDLRPSTDRVRLAFFNALGALVPGSRFLDLFCGSGAVGLEALSRGAAHVAFCDSQRRCTEAVRAALDELGLAGLSWELLPMDHARAIQRLAPGRPFDLAYVDPPYDAALGAPTLRLLLGAGLLAPGPGTRAVLEHAGREPSPEVPGLALFRRYDHGAAALSVYGLEENAHAAS